MPRKFSKSKSVRRIRRSKSKRSRSFRRFIKKGGGHILNLEAGRIGGLPPNMGYSECCPPIYKDGMVAYNASGNRMCGGGRKRRLSKRSQRSKRRVRKVRRTSRRR